MDGESNNLFLYNDNTIDGFGNRTAFDAFICSRIYVYHMDDFPFP